MLIKLIGQNTMKKLILPDNGSGQYSIKFGNKNSESELVFTKELDTWVISKTFNCYVQDIKPYISETMVKDYSLLLSKI